MATFESNTYTIPVSQATVYERLSDLGNLEQLKAHLPSDKAQGLTFDAESISVEIPAVGKVTLQIVEKEPCKRIKYATTTSPLPFNLLVDLQSTEETSCKLKLSIDMSINPFMKSMVQKPLQESLEKMAGKMAEAMGQQR